jgi:hypothetical protein
MRSHWHHARGSVASIALASLGIGCGSQIESDDDRVDPATALSDLSSEIVGNDSYPRSVAARGAFTCELTLAGDYPPGQVPPDLERDRMVMSRAARGMLVKYLPIAFDPQGTITNGQPNLLSGGRYLFKTAKQAERYHDFVENEFRLDGVQFLDRDIFLRSECHHYAVVRAYEFTPLHSTHVLIRVERFAMTGAKPVKRLEALWPQLQQEAGDRDMAAVWLIYNEDESVASIAYLNDRVVPADRNAPDFASLEYLTQAPALGHFLESLGWARTFDQTQWILTIWHPFVFGDHGEPSDWPYSPPFGAPSCGDGVCEVSRGERSATCSTDCPAQCGNAICQPSQGENDHNCPGDCGG